MPPKHLAHLEHIRDSAELIRDYVAGHTLETYLEDRQTRDAVERRFILIGEALNRLRRDAPGDSRPHRQHRPDRRLPQHHRPRLRPTRPPHRVARDLRKPAELAGTGNWLA
ncbi:MAG: HepT-like ribonuclease domain-containing protein [Planctomycetota bacterium]